MFLYRCRSMPKYGEYFVANINQLVKTDTPGVYKLIKKEVQQKSAPQKIVEISKTASDCITNVQQGIIKSQKHYPKLNRYSNASDYFGVYSAQGIQWRFNNQIALTWIKTRDQNLVTFPPIVLSDSSNIKSIKKSLDIMKKRCFGRFTITDKLFGQNGQGGMHTVGMVYHKGRYIILDSIPETYPEIKNYHERLLKHLGLNPKNVVFSNKPQQTMDEYTCNNWTHANLEAVMDYLKSSPEGDLTPEVFDEILPKDINFVLRKQFIQTSNELKGRDLSELVVEHFNKTHKMVRI